MTMKSTVLRLELIIASLLPVAAILVTGVVGTAQMATTHIGFFLFVVLFCAAAIFTGELALLLMTQQAVKNQYLELVVTCQEFMSGNRARRPAIQGDTALTLLARTLHGLLETVVDESTPDAAPQRQTPQTPHTLHTPPLPATPQKQAPQREAMSGEINLINKQLQQLVQEIIPVTDGDLRVRATVPAGKVGVIADICNAFIEELVDLVRWTRYSAEQVISRTQNLFVHSVELAQTAETQMLGFSQTTEAFEKLVTFVQRLCSMLQLSVEIVQHIEGSIQRLQETPALHESGGTEKQDTANTTVFYLHKETKRLSQLLREMVYAAQNNSIEAESMIADLYMQAKRLHQSSTAILRATEHVNELAVRAEQWRNAVISFQLPDTQDQLDEEDGSEYLPYEPPLATASQQRRR